MENNKKLKPFFHTIYHTEIIKVRDKEEGYISENYRRPLWCGYEYALSKKLGCVSLMDFSKNNSDRKKVSANYCSDCDMFKKK
jgi:hypothetical protein